MADDGDYWKLAARFVEFVNKETGLPVIVCDEQGVIRQAVVKARIGTLHAGAQRIMRDRVDEVFVTAEDAAKDPKVKEGYNCPILHDGRRIGTFGIAGPLEVTRPMARVSAAVLASWLKELEQQRSLGSATGQVLGALESLSDELAAAEGSAKATLSSVTAASSTAGEKLASADEALRGVHGISQQSRMLAINASVEATRAGDQGRAFGVIAREMLTLADDARAASGKIQGSLKDVSGAVTQLVQAGRTSSDESARLVATMGRMVERLEGLRGLIDMLGGGGDRL
jgi:methyl-accepting chemotaxis protein